MVCLVQYVEFSQGRYGKKSKSKDRPKCRFDIFFVVVAVTKTINPKKGKYFVYDTIKHFYAITNKIHFLLLPCPSNFSKMNSVLQLFFLFCCCKKKQELQCKWSHVKTFKFFFFKQKTAYEIASCLVGSEMCIRDSYIFGLSRSIRWVSQGRYGKIIKIKRQAKVSIWYLFWICCSNKNN